jgi:hypothetical protein
MPSEIFKNRNCLCWRRDWELSDTASIGTYAADRFLSAITTELPTMSVFTSWKRGGP